MTVNAPYSSEAKELVEGMVPGCNVISVTQGQKYENGNSGGLSIENGLNLIGISILFCSIIGVWIIVSFWPIILVFGAIGLFIWVYKVIKEDN